MILRRKELQTIEVPVSMHPNTISPFKIFHSWLVVGKYLLYASLLGIARVDYHIRSPDDN